MSDVWLIVLGIGVLVILFLFTMAAWMWLKVLHLENQRKEQEELIRQIGFAKRESINKSIQVLAKSALDEQVSLTESAIRIRVLLDCLSVDSSVREEFKAFYELSAATDHIPILEQWKQLSSAKKQAFDKEREQLESDHHEFVLDAAKRILGRNF